MRPRMGAVLICLVLAACSSAGVKPSLESVPTTSAESASNGVIVIGSVTFEFTMTCYAPGTGAVVAVGSGLEPVTGRPTRALVQAFFRDAYVAVTVGENEEVYEPTLAEPVDLYFQDGVIRGGGITFVRNLDLTARAGEEAGLGSVVVTCSTFENGLPPSYR